MKSATLILHFNSIREMLSYISDHNLDASKTSKEVYQLRVSMAKSSQDTDGVPFVYSKRVCDECGHEYEPKQDRSRFCSVRCGKRFYMRDYFSKRVRVNGKYVLREKASSVEPVDPEPVKEEEEDHESRSKNIALRRFGKETFYNGLSDMP